jgi:hypothetical protein
VILREALVAYEVSRRTGSDQLQAKSFDKGITESGTKYSVIEKMIAERLHSHSKH